MDPPRYAIDHVQITVPRAAEAAVRRFYGDGLGCREIPKPAERQRNGEYRRGPGGNRIEISQRID